MELKGFERITLQPGEERTVTFRLTVNDLAFYDLDMNRIAEPGSFTVYAGGSSTSVQEASFRLTGDVVSVPNRGPLPLRPRDNR
jgi:beta-glucosidase